MLSKLIIALYVLATSGALVLLKLGSSAGAPVSISDGRPVFNINLTILAGGLFYGISFLLYMFLISKHDLGYIIPLTTAIVYILIFFASFAIFKESFTALKIVGIALIVGGVILLNLK
jgi:small multidrug resistance pump